MSRPRSNIIGSYYRPHEGANDKKSHFEEFLNQERTYSRSQFRHSKSSDKLRNIQSRGSITKGSMKKQQSMTDLQRKHDQTPSNRPSTKNSHKDSRFSKSPY